MSVPILKDSDKDLEFVYDDSGFYENEISEVYSYTEETEFESNLENFECLLKDKGYRTWHDLLMEQKRSLIMHIVQVIEVTDKSERFKAISCILYLVQGTFGECFTAKEQKASCRENCFLLYKHGLFGIIKELLMMEIELSERTQSKKSTLLSIKDSKELRGLLTILYIMVETIRRENSTDNPDMQEARKEFINDLGQGFNDSESLVMLLFNMISKFCSETSSPFPMKKVLLLLWKLLLTILGGHRSLRDLKIKKREEAGLSILDENPIKIVQEMKASVPPTSASDILDMAQGPGKRRPRKGAFYEFDGDSSEADLDGSRNGRTDAPFEEEKVTSIDDDLVDATEDPDAKSIMPPTEEEEKSKAVLDKTNGVVAIGDDDTKRDEDSYRAADPGFLTPMPSGQQPAVAEYVLPADDKVDTGLSTRLDSATLAAKLVKLRRQQQEVEEGAAVPSIKVISGLPWVPKVRENDVEAFLNLVRQKFIGFPLPGDLTTDAGLPNPTLDSIQVLKKHKYTSLTELQVAKEKEINKYPLTIGKTEVVPDTLAERLYQAMLPHLPQYMIALLKILLAAAPTSKAKNDSINILSDVLPEEMPTTAVASIKLGIDVNRHREIIVKAISGIVLLVLKHFKLSHVYQFEYASQHLVFANCIPLVLKFFNQNIVAYVTTKNTIPSLDFPACVIGEKSELTAESLEGIDNDGTPCWRNLFSSINLLRILNKLVKWKHSRTMMLVVFKSAPILKRALKVRQAMFQLYVLKLLKIQTKYLGRQWRKSNMKIMSAIYQKVRHRLNDDWAYGNDLDAQPWDFQQEERALRTNVEKFNMRRYHTTGSHVGGTPSVVSVVDDDYEPVENNMQNLLREEVELPVDFRKSYDVWLEREVYFSGTDWDQLLQISCIQ